MPHLRARLLLAAGPFLVSLHCIVAIRNPAAIPPPAGQFPGLGRGRMNGSGNCALWIWRSGILRGRGRRRSRRYWGNSTASPALRL